MTPILEANRTHELRAIQSLFQKHLQLSPDGLPFARVKQSLEKEWAALRFSERIPMPSMDRLMNEYVALADIKTLALTLINKVRLQTFRLCAFSYVCRHEIFCV